MSIQSLSNKPLRRHHLTLIEMMVAMVALVLIMGFLIQLVASINKLGYTQRAQADIYEQQRLFFDILSRDLEGMVATDAPGKEISLGFPVGYVGVWITSSGIGLNDSDTMTLMEVGYFLDTSDSTVKRYFTSASDAGDYDFLGKTDQSWASSWEDSPVVAYSVRNFTMKAYAADGSAVDANNDTAVPSRVEVELQLYDPRVEGVAGDAEVEKTLKTFNKTIYLNRGY